MGKYILGPEKIERHSRVYSNAFLWNEKNIYIMDNHRLALWCWLQHDKIFNGKYNLIHIDRHTDARKWVGIGESECLKKILPNFKNLKKLSIYQNITKTVNINQIKKKQPCITYDNFIHLAVKAKLFNHYYMYSPEGDWETKEIEKKFNFYKKILDVRDSLSKDIEKSANNCVLDIDLDFFDDDFLANHWVKSISGDELLKIVFNTVLGKKDVISLITISLNETPGDDLWKKRQAQLSNIKQILNLDVLIPIMK